VRIWHWVMAAVPWWCWPGVAGYLIGSAAAGGRRRGLATTSMFGYIRFAHFAAAYIFGIFFVWRVIWAFFGNRYSREIFLVPLKMLTAVWWKGFFDQVLHYMFIKDAGPGWATTRWR